MEKDYLHESQKYTEARVSFSHVNPETYHPKLVTGCCIALFRVCIVTVGELNREKRCAISRCRAVENFMNFCNQLAEQIQQILDKLPSEKTKEVIDHVSLSLTNTMINIFLFKGLDIMTNI